MGLLEGKVVIVTGAGRGIGRGEALEVVSQGGAVVVGEFDADAGQEVVDEITKNGGQAALVTGDVAEVDVAEKLVATAVERFGQLDALVNNAGVLRDRTILKMTPEEWDAVIRVHLRGTYTTTHAAANHWKDGGRPGHVVCTASTSGVLGNFGQSNYGAAKAGIAAFATITAWELRKYDITVNAICPAARTRMTQGAYGDKLEDTGPAFDFWHPDNVAPMVAFLCSDAASHISGKVFGVQGDVVEIYRPYTSVAEIAAGGHRWDPEVLATKVDGLLAEGGITPEAENRMLQLRHSMTQR